MAVIAKQRYKLDIAPKGGWAIVYASQHDDGAREIEFAITNQGNAFSIPASINVSVQGIKINGSYFSHSCSYSGNIVTMALADDMTDIVGKAICVLKFTNSSQQKLATAKFILNVDSDSSSEGVIIDTEAEEIFNQMLNDIRAQAASISVDIAELQSKVGTPLVASTVSAMTDHNKIYVYVGSESGCANGNWYYWNGSAWTSGGVYNSIAFETDPTLTQSRQAADAKETGKVRDDVILDETTLLQVPLSIAKFEAYSYWTFGSKISPTTGITSNNEPAYCRSTWVAITEPILVTMANPDYEWCVWGYSNNASAAGTYSPSPVYSDRPVIIRPIKGTTYFRLSVRRKDLATLTTPYSDQTSDAYKILTSLKTLVLTDDTFSVSGVPADSKAVGDMFAQLTVAEGSAWE